ncbi:protein of unknown function (plasmid) [Azospirillum baldaniorum]|uniref:Uncharacterized protein n=1 Tax=Azospirillum baldaniorum TaxID=1064539 RepID=A0A9P1JZH8_9PROT|nr:protein of unknown function [Azospirillum baldaniorum]
MRKRCDSAGSAEADGIRPLVNVTMDRHAAAPNATKPDVNGGLMERDSS